MIGKAITNEESCRIISMPLLSKSLPYKFPNGSLVGGITAACSGCGKEISIENTRGEITPTNRHSCALNAYALCFDCKLVTPLVMIFADDGSYLAKGPDGWRPGRYAPEQPDGWLSRLKNYLGWR